MLYELYLEYQSLASGKPFVYPTRRCYSSIEECAESVAEYNKDLDPSDTMFIKRWWTVEIKATEHKV